MLASASENYLVQALAAMPAVHPKDHPTRGTRHREKETYITRSKGI